MYRFDTSSFANAGHAAWVRPHHDRRSPGWVSFVGAMAVMSALAPAPAMPQEGWQYYVDPNFGTELYYPAYLFQSATPTATGLIMQGPEATLEISALRGQGIDTVAELRAFVTAGLGYEAVTYSPEGRGWLVLSGYRGDRVYYQKLFLVGDTIQGFSFEYPVANRAFYDPMVEMLEDSFRAG
ncbi:MAG: hypothetical protein AB7O56_15410 [Bauldia sp.]